MGQCHAASLALGHAAVELCDLERTRQAVNRKRRLQRQQRQADLRARVARRRDEAGCCVRLRSLVSPKGHTFAEDFELTGTSVGSGANGDVLLARSRDSSQRVVAVKVLRKASFTGTRIQAVRREAFIHLSMDHAHIAQLLRVFDDPDCVYLVMEYCAGGSLLDRLKQAPGGCFSERQGADVLRQALCAVSYCHARPGGAVCHRDLKPGNFVYGGRDGECLKLVDFGLSRAFEKGDPQPQKAVGTLPFMAPEVVAKRRHDESCDLWSLGILAYCLLTGTLPYDQGNTVDELTAFIANGCLDLDGPAWSKVSEAGKDFVEHLLREDPAERPRAADALRHAWLTEAGSPHRAPSTPLSLDVANSIRAFSQRCPSHRAAAAIVFYSDGGLAEDDVHFLDEQFHLLDTDGNGTLSADELTGALHHSLGLSAEECKSIFESMDFVVDNAIQRSEFLTAVMASRWKDRQDTMQNAFSRLDVDKTGKISEEALGAALGTHFCGVPTTTIFEDADRNGDKAIDFDEFVALLSRLGGEHCRPVAVMSSPANSEDVSLPPPFHPPAHQRLRRGWDVAGTCPELPWEVSACASLGEFA